MKKRSIQEKLLFITLGSIIALTTVITVCQVYLDYKEGEKMLARHIELVRNSIAIKGKILSKDIARYTENAIAMDNFFSISEAMEKLVKDTDDLEYGILVDNLGVVHVHTENPKLLETKLDSDVDKFALQQSEQRTFEYEKDSSPYLEFITPVKTGDTPWGFLRLGFSLATIETEIQNVRLSMKKHCMADILTSVGITLVFAFIGSLLVAYGTKRVINPLLQLAEFSRKLVDENFNVEIPKSITTSNDEIGELGRSFEYMAKQIDLSHIQLKGYSQNLEQEIIVRRYAVDQLTERIKHAEFSADIGTSLASGETLHETLQKCTEAMVKHLDAAFARIWTYNEKEKMLELRASAGMYTHIDGKHSRVPLGKLKVGLIAEERLPCLTNSVIGDTRIPDQDWAKSEGMKAFAGYPLVIENSVIGVMAMFSKKEIAADTINTMEVVANQVALGIERKLAESAQKQFSAKLVESQENERKRIASELHDSLAQNMTVINNEAQSFTLNMKKDVKDLDIRKLMSSIASGSLRISSTALESLKKIKEIAYNLRPAELDQIGLKKTIEWASKMVSKSSGIDIHAKIDLKETTISKELEIQIYRIIQEGLNNIVKHSLASEGIIELKCKDGHISLLIIDDGKGFENHYQDEQASTMDGFGLRGIEERVKIFDGTLLVDSSLGKGTKLKISIPIKR